MKLPKAKSKDIVVMNVENEVLIYDLKNNKAFCLNETATVVYQHCDGKTTSAEVSEKHKVSNDLIFFALDELKKEQLLETNAGYKSPFARMTRREIVRKIGFDSMIVLPLVASVIAPSSVNAGSCNGFGFIPCNPPGVNIGVCGGLLTSCISYCDTRGFQACISRMGTATCIPSTDPRFPDGGNCNCFCA